MNISRNFLVVGSLYLLVGLVLGTYMGASGNHTLTGVHAHINLLGFVLMSVFGLIYHVFPAMARNGLAKIHFWVHQVSVLVFVAVLYLVISGTVAEKTLALVLPVVTTLIILATVVFVWNLYQNGKES